jgi:CRISPR-associated endoribonuclease Cas6
MLVSLVLQIRPRVNCELPATLGNAMHAFFIDLVARNNWVMAHELHAARAEKPFTISPLQGHFSFQDGSIVLDSQKEYWLRFTSIETALSHLLLELNEKSIGEVDLLGAKFAVTKVTSSPDEHPWAGSTTFERMYDGIVASQQPLPRKIKLRLFSPTTFHSNNRSMPLPIPRLVFAHLSQKWNAFSPIHLGSDVANVIEEKVSLSRYEELRTQMLDFGDYRQVGFVGECEFLIHLEKDDIRARVIHLLADFAFYGGVGYRTTMGMGQARRMD